MSRLDGLANPRGGKAQALTEEELFTFQSILEGSPLRGSREDGVPLEVKPSGKPGLYAVTAPRASKLTREAFPKMGPFSQSFQRKLCWLSWNFIGYQ